MEQSNAALIISIVALVLVLPGYVHMFDKHAYAIGGHGLGGGFGHFRGGFGHGFRGGLGLGGLQQYEQNSICPYPEKPIVVNNQLICAILPGDTS